MKKRVVLGIVLLAACALIAVIPLLTIKDSEFGGADGAAEEVVVRWILSTSLGRKALLRLPAVKQKAFCSVSRPVSARQCWAMVSAICAPARNTAEKLPGKNARLRKNNRRTAHKGRAARFLCCRPFPV